MRSLPEPFAERLHIFPDEQAASGFLAADPQLVLQHENFVGLAKVIWQLKRLVGLADAGPKWTTGLEAMYNLGQDPELTNARDLTRRLKVLEHRYGVGWSVSRMNSELCKLRTDYLHPALKKDKLPWPPEDQIAKLARSEAAYEANRDSRVFVLPEHTFGELIADQRYVGRDGLGCFLPQATLHFAVSAAGNLVTTATATFGEMLATFTTAGLLMRYQTEVRAPGSDRHTVARGRLVLDTLVEKRVIGLVVNPLGGHGASVGQHWTAEELVRL